MKTQVGTLYSFIVSYRHFTLVILYGHNLWIFVQLYRLRPRPSPRPLKPRRLCWRVSTARGRRRSGPPQPSAGPRPCVWGGSLSTLGRALHAETSETSMLFSALSRVHLLLCDKCFKIRCFRMQVMGIAIKAWNYVITLFFKNWCILISALRYRWN